MPKVRLRDLNPAIFLNKVGIGTDDPAELLDVVGGNVRIGKTTNGRLIIENSSGTVKVQLDSNGDSYINGGKVGIGTGGNAPNGKLSVRETVTDTECYVEIRTVSNGGGDPYIKFDGGGTNFIVGEKYMGTTNNYLVLGPGENTDTISGIFVKGNGWVGIGTGSSTPTANLQIHSDNPGGGARMLDVSTQHGNIFSVVNGHQNRDDCYLRSEGVMYLGTNADIDTVCIDGGKVGVGTNSQTSIFTVREDVSYSKTILLANNNSVNGRYSSIVSQHSTTDHSFESSIRFIKERTGENYGSSIGFLTELDSGNRTLDYRLYIKNDKVGIGTGLTTPVNKLQIAGGTSITDGGHAGPVGSDGLHLMFDWASKESWIKSENNGATNRGLQFGASQYVFNYGNVRIGATDGSSKLNVGGDICLLASNGTGDRMRGITERVTMLDNHNGDSSKEFNLADITRNTASWGNSCYMVEIFAHYPSGGSYSKYFVYYAYGNSGVKTIQEPVGINVSGYGVRLAGEQTISGNIKRASIMVDLPAYGRATIKLTHNGVYTAGTWTSSNENEAGRIKYNI